MIARPIAALLCVCGATLSLSAASQDYRKFVGQQKEICGRVVEYTTAFKRHCDIALMIGERSKKWKFAAVVPKSSRQILSAKPESYLLEDVCVSGLVVEENKKPYIKVENPEQLRIAKTSRPFAPDAARDCDDGAQLPKVLLEVKPEYSRAAMREKVQGAVVVEIVVAADGTVTDGRVIRSLHPDLDASALRSAKAWRFSSPTVHGQPAAMVVMIELTFRLT